jgi:hypothetical protein
MKEEQHQERRCLFQTRDYSNTGQNSEKQFWVRVPVKMFSVARKLSTIEKWRQDESYLFLQEDYTNKGHRSETVLGWSPGEDIL